jgi:hypothetical protein
MKLNVRSFLLCCGKLNGSTTSPSNNNGTTGGGRLEKSVLAGEKGNCPSGEVVDEVAASSQSGLEAEVSGDSQQQPTQPNDDTASQLQTAHHLPLMPTSAVALSRVPTSSSVFA